ncbi:MAG: MBL fold metallo-hydrolase [Clostridiales bacterium]|nr:MBL fold metallo-hydrolase [Clostridiales bacterium]
MRRVHIKTLVLGGYQANCYLVRSNDTKDVVVIDPGNQVEKIKDYLTKNDLECKRILLTHGHFDHIGAASQLRALTGAKIYIHEKDGPLLRDPNLNVSAYAGDGDISFEADELLKDDEEFVEAGLSWQVMHTPGHTSGGVCYYLKDEGEIFTGDTIFYESVGRSDFPTGNQQTLIDTISNKLMILDDSIELYPGHGRPTTIGHERKYNPFFKIYYS